MLIWQSYFLKVTAKTFLFIFTSLVALYVMIDLSVHGERLQGNFLSFCWRNVTQNYELFLSFSFLLALLKVLFDLSRHQEFLALQMAGLSRLRLFAPFFLLALLLSASCFFNRESEMPLFKKKKKGALVSQELADGSTVVYQRKEKELFVDLFWIRSPSDIWHVEQFDPREEVHDAHHFTRLENGRMIKEDLPMKEAPDISKPLDPVATPAFRETHFHHKVFVSLTPLFLVLCMGPMTSRFSRQKRFLLKAAISIFAFVAFRIILDGMMILGENQVLSPLLAIWGLPMFLTFASLATYATAKKLSRTYRVIQRNSHS